MKRSTKKLESEDAGASGDSSAGKGGLSSWFCVFGICRKSYRVLICVLLLLLSAIAYLTIVGFPKRIVDTYLDDFNQRNQIGLAVGKIRFFPPDTIWIKDLRVEGSHLDSLRFFKCDDCWVRLGWSKIGDVEAMVSRVNIENGELNLRLYEDEDLRLAPSILHFTDIGMKLRQGEGVWKVNSLAANIDNVEIKSSGNYYPKESRSGEEGRTLEKYANTLALIDLLKEMGVDDNVERWHREYRDWRLLDRVKVNAEFEIYSGDRDRDTVRLTTESRRMEVRSRVLKDVRVNAVYANRCIQADKISFASEGEKLAGSFSYDLESSELAGAINSQLTGPNLLKLSPSAVSTELKSRQISMNGAVELDCAFGPAKIEQLARNVSGHFSAVDVKYRDAALDNLTFEFRRKGNDIEVSDVELALGAGDISGSAKYNMDTKRFSGAGRARIDPRRLLPFASSEKTKKIISSVKVDSDLVKFDGKCGGALGVGEQYYAAGTLEGKHFTYKGVAWDKFRSGIVYTNRTIAFNDFTLSRPEGVASGHVGIDFNTGVLQINAVSGCDPLAVAGIVGSEWVERLDDFHFNGPVQISADGIINYSNLAENNLDMSVSARLAEYQGMIADQIDFNASMAGCKLALSNITGRACGGDFSGRAQLKFDSEDDEQYSVDYDVQAKIKDANLDALVIQLRSDILAENNSGDEIDAYKGRLNADLSINGVYEKDNNLVKDGQYNVAIREGNLFKVRLLGGLSKYLSKIIPGFGYLSQTELFSSGLLRGDRVLIENVELRGGVVTVKGHGDYFYDRTLSVDTQVVPMRNGVVASVMRLVMFPVSKIFEFTLTGTLKDPQWKPKNLPKQLFLKFD